MAYGKSSADEATCCMRRHVNGKAKPASRGSVTSPESVDLIAIATLLIGWRGSAGLGKPVPQLPSTFAPPPTSCHRAHTPTHHPGASYPAPGLFIPFASLSGCFRSWSRIAHGSCGHLEPSPPILPHPRLHTHQAPTMSADMADAPASSASVSNTRLYLGNLPRSG